MTAATHPAGQNQPSGMQTAAAPLRRLMRVTLRQHQTALLWAGVVVAVLAIVLAATGVPLHGLAARGAPGWFGASRASVDYGGVLQAFALALQLAALLAGMFLGAPLLPREIGEGTAKLAWTQAANARVWPSAAASEYQGQPLSFEVGHGQANHRALQVQQMSDVMGREDRREDHLEHDYQEHWDRPSSDASPSPTTSPMAASSSIHQMRTALAEPPGPHAAQEPMQMPVVTRGGRTSTAGRALT